MIHLVGESIKPSKDQSFRINRNTMMEDNNAQSPGGGALASTYAGSSDSLDYTWSPADLDIDVLRLSYSARN